MADDEHIARLKQGLEAWNAWRSENPAIRGGRAAMIGGQQHQRPMRPPHLLGARARLKSQDLVGLLLRHRPRLRAAARPRIVVALSVFTPAGKPAVEIRL
jgi:hypothetical protein